MKREHKACRVCKRSCCEADEGHEDGRLRRWTYESDAKVDADLEVLVLSGKTDWYCSKVLPCFNLHSFCVYVRDRCVFTYVALLTLTASLGS